MSTRRTLRRVHIWLGWIVGVPLLFWTVSGVWMAARPIEEVRGSALRRPDAPLRVPASVVLPVAANGAKALAMQMQDGRAVWIMTLADGRTLRADPAAGALLPPPAPAEVARLAQAAFAGEAKLAGIRRTDAAHPPLELRRPVAAWQARFADGTHVYLDATTGQVLALRTEQWRAYDWMWGLHIMDLQTREETSHAMLILMAVIAVIGSAIAIVLLPMSVRRRTARQPRLVATPQADS